MKIGITGAAGGIGSCLADNLFELGFEIVLVDDLSSGQISNFKIIDNIESLNKIDIRDEEKLLKVFNGCTHIIHLAAISSLAACQLNPSQAMAINVGGTASVSSVANKLGAALIFASTSAIYENNHITPFSEEQSTSPNLVYPLSKKFSEEIINALSATNGLNFVILRFFNVFGPRQDVKRTNPPLVNYLIREHVLGKKSKTYAPNEQARDYIHVDDLLDFIKLWLKESKKLPNKTFNVCSGVPISLQEIIESIEKGLSEKIDTLKGEPEELWEMYPELFSGGNPLNLKFVLKETLKNSIGDPNKAYLECGWRAERNVLKEIEKSTSEMKIHIRRSLGI